MGNLTSHDPLTGLSDRSLLQDCPHQAIGYSTNYTSPILIAFIDLDRFKCVYDSAMAVCNSEKCLSLLVRGK